MDYKKIRQIREFLSSLSLQGVWFTHLSVTSLYTMQLSSLGVPKYQTNRLKDVREKIFQSIDFFYNFHCRQIMSYLCQNARKLGIIDFVSDIERVKKYPILGMYR